MPRKQVPIIAGDPYQITARGLNREWFDLPMDTVWSIMEDYLYLIHQAYQVRLHAFLLMSNHFHLMISAPDNNLSEALLYFMRETSKEITRLSGRINQTYGARNHKTHLGNVHYFMNTYKYVYQNPVRAGIVARVEEYRYSTIHGLCGLNRLIIPLESDTLLFNPQFDESVLAWLNTKPDPKHVDEMRRALRHPKFELKKSRKNGKASELEKLLL